MAWNVFFFAVILMLVELGLEDFGENFDGFLGNVFHEILTNNFIFMGGFFFRMGHTRTTQI